MAHLLVQIVAGKFRPKPLAADDYLDHDGPERSLHPSNGHNGHNAHS